jgi:hypothetical protein
MRDGFCVKLLSILCSTALLVKQLFHRYGKSKPDLINVLLNFNATKNAFSFFAK